MADDGRKSDAGSTLTVTVEDGGTADDISAATTQQIKLRKPDGTLSAITSSFVTDGTDGQVQITLNSGVINQVGSYGVQVYIEGVGFKYHTSIGYKTFGRIFE